MEESSQKQSFISKKVGTEKFCLQICFTYTTESKLCFFKEFETKSRQINYCVMPFVPLVACSEDSSCSASSSKRRGRRHLGAEIVVGISMIFIRNTFYNRNLNKNLECSPIPIITFQKKSQKVPSRKFWNEFLKTDLLKY